MCSWVTHLYFVSSTVGLFLTCVRVCFAPAGCTLFQGNVFTKRHRSTLIMLSFLRSFNDEERLTNITSVNFFSYRMWEFDGMFIRCKEWDKNRRNPGFMSTSSSKKRWGRFFVWASEFVPLFITQTCSGAPSTYDWSRAYVNRVSGYGINFLDVCNGTVLDYAEVAGFSQPRCSWRLWALSVRLGWTHVRRLVDNDHCLSQLLSLALPDRPGWITCVEYVISFLGHTSPSAPFFSGKVCEVTSREGVFAHVSIFSAHAPHALRERLFIWRWRQVFPIDLCFRTWWCDGEGNNGLAGMLGLDPWVCVFWLSDLQGQAVFPCNNEVSAERTSSQCRNRRCAVIA